MTSGVPNVLTLPVDVKKLPPVEGVGEDGIQIAGRADEGRRMLIDMACAKLGKKRAHFLIEAATDRAIEVLSAA